MKRLGWLAFAALLLTGGAHAGSPVAVCGLSGTAGQSNCVIPNSDGSINVTPTSGGTQDTNIAQVVGVTAAAGNGVATVGTLRVTIASDSAGVVALGQAAMAASVPVAIASDQSAVKVGFNIGNANVQPHVCGSWVYKHITTNTDTQIVAADGSKTIYICDYSFSANAANNIYLEKATSGTCATLTQIDQIWYLTANSGKTASNAFYRGLNTGSSAQLCVNTSAAQSFDIAVNYDQY